MNLLVNNQKIQDLPGRSDTLSAVLQTVQDNCVAAEEVITSVLVDGQMLTAQQLSDWQKRPADEFGEIHVTIEPRNVFACRGLRKMAAELARTTEDRGQILEYMADGNNTEAMAIMGDYLQTWHTTQQALNSACRLMNIDLDSMEVCCKSPKKQKLSTADYINLLSEQLNKVKAALDANDMVLLSDIFEYELTDVTDQWLDLLLQLAEKFEKENRKTN
jgi:hypothetical protein